MFISWYHRSSHRHSLFDDAPKGRAPAKVTRSGFDDEEPSQRSRGYSDDDRQSSRGGSSGWGSRDEYGSNTNEAEEDDGWGRPQRRQDNDRDGGWGGNSGGWGAPSRGSSDRDRYGGGSNGWNSTDDRSGYDRGHDRGRPAAAPAPPREAESATKRFASATSISSKQFFGEEESPAANADKNRRLAKFSGAKAISSADFYERDESGMRRGGDGMSCSCLVDFAKREGSRKIISAPRTFLASESGCFSLDSAAVRIASCVG